MVFDAVAAEYERHRPGYPDALIDHACEVAGLAPAAPVLEVGCGTGQLTRSLLERDLRVTAVEPGQQLLTRARDQLAGAGQVAFLNARLEEARLPHAGYQAAFSASAIHWVDPGTGWRLLADALVDHGTLALISYFGLEDPHSDEDQQAFRRLLASIAPELASEWPTYRDLETTLAGAAQRRGNVSEVWAWLGSYDVARPDVSELFNDVQLAVTPVHVEHTAEAFSGLLATMSFWARLSLRQREALIAEIQALHQQLGRPIRSSTVACLVTARRTRRV
jgi:SAM-dependent methyltransferase